MISTALRAIHSLNEIVWAFICVLSKCWHLLLITSLMLLCSTLVSSLSNSLSWVHLITNYGHFLVLLVQTSLAAEPWLRAHAVRACTS